MKGVVLQLEDGPLLGTAGERPRPGQDEARGGPTHRTRLQAVQIGQAGRRRRAEPVDEAAGAEDVHALGEHAQRLALGHGQQADGALALADGH